MTRNRLRTANALVFSSSHLRIQKRTITRTDRVSVYVNGRGDLECARIRNRIIAWQYQKSLLLTGKHVKHESTVGILKSSRAGIGRRVSSKSRADARRACSSRRLQILKSPYQNSIVIRKNQELLGMYIRQEEVGGEKLQACLVKGSKIILRY